MNSEIKYVSQHEPFTFLTVKSMDGKNTIEGYYSVLFPQTLACSIYIVHIQVKYTKKQVEKYAIHKQMNLLRTRSSQHNTAAD